MEQAGDEYTPTTDDVFQAYASEGDGGIAMIADHSRAAFDRWLHAQLRQEEYRSEVYREAWHTAEAERDAALDALSRSAYRVDVALGFALRTLTDEQGIEFLRVWHEHIDPAPADVASS